MFIYDDFERVVIWDISIDCTDTIILKLYCREIESIFSCQDLHSYAIII